MIRAERAVLDMLRRNASAPHPIPLRDAIMRWGALAVIFSPLRIPVPPAVAFIRPSEGKLDLDELKAGWADCRAGLTTALSSLSGEALTMGVVQHPVTGWLTAEGALLFLRSHNHHHNYQLTRLKRYMTTSGSGLRTA